MYTPDDLRRQAEDCRRAAARSGKRPRTSHYLLDLAEHYEGQAAKLEAADYLAFLRSSAAKTILEKYGFKFLVSPTT